MRLRPPYRFRRYGAGSAMGDTQPPTVGQLVAQINRFGPSAPPAYRLGINGIPFDPATVQVTLPLAVAAVSVYQRAAAEAYSRFGDAASLDRLNLANQGFSDPVMFVNSHLADVIATIAGYGDSVGIKAADGTLTQGIFAGLSTSTVLLLAAGAVLLLMGVGNERRSDIG